MDQFNNKWQFIKINKLNISDFLIKQKEFLFSYGSYHHSDTMLAPPLVVSDDSLSLEL